MTNSKEPQTEPQLPALRPGHDYSLTQVVADDFSGPPLVSNFGADPDEVKRLELLAQNEPDKRVTDLAGETFCFRWWSVSTGYVHDDETGEQRPILRICLVSPDGETLVTSSLAIARALDTICRARGTGPLDPPECWGFEQVNTRRGRRTFRIVPVDPPK